MRQRLTKALECEPLEDMLKSLPIDAEAWLQLYENSAIEMFCSPDREEDDKSGDETDVESMVERSLLDAKFGAPSRQDESSSRASSASPTGGSIPTPSSGFTSAASREGRDAPAPAGARGGRRRRTRSEGRRRSRNSTVSFLW
ncbi:MAG: hypothetical protein BJ554DRAFT_5357 [Olpidium bornovanus]|uniref:Uncharacterized protein n=1 Tax=Olpidium bornovanus TaxID=278681 RepID=A0A8H7ZZR7_9FUNG|nr:MAG: hypothetical protein BJ554DRAFT_5357 [Olpidium bornovanus]